MSGGGFMTGSQGGSQSDSPGGKKSSGPTAIRPVNVHQINTADQDHPQADFMIDGTEVTQVSLVACVRHMNQSTSILNLTVEDGTGQLDIRYWSTGDADDGSADPIATLENNSYVRILGTLKVFSNKRHIVAQALNPVTDFNEVLFHTAEVILVHLKAVGNLKAGGGRGGEDRKPNIKNGHNPYEAVGNPAKGSGGVFDDLKGNELKVMNFYLARETANEVPSDGFHYAEVCKAIGSTLPLDQFKEIMVSIAEKGHLYAAEDDDHFLAMFE